MGYVPNTAADRQAMPAGDLFADIPQSLRLKAPPPLPPPLSEPELFSALKQLAEKNTAADLFLGAGACAHFIPSAVKHLIGRSEFYTAYTPYQSEISQGILQAIYEYQSMLCSLTGMEAANASMYDGATAMAEAALLACRIKGKKSIAVSSAVHPGYREVLKTYAAGADLVVNEIRYDKDTGKTAAADTEAACVIFQQPNFFGCLEDIRLENKGPLLIVCADPVSLGVLRAPGEYGADIVVGEGQGLGNPRSFGGPGLGIFAARKNLMRLIPGRIVGKTTDIEGKPAYCLTLQTREQHIRRERAGSNICTNQALAALAATAYLSIMGKTGLPGVAQLCLQKSNYLRSKIRAGAPSSLIFPDTPCFNEFVVRSDKKVGLALDRYYPELKGCRLICVTELVTKKMLDELLAGLI